MWNDPWLVGLGCMIVGAGARSSINYVRSRSGRLAGSWDQLVLDPKTQAVVKKDVVQCRHIGAHVEGTIQRFDPVEQSGKTWRFSGQVREKLLFGIYWTDNEKKNPGSYGTLQLYIPQDGPLEGFYVRMNETQSRKKSFSTELSSVPLKWEQRKPTGS